MDFGDVCMLELSSERESVCVKKGKEGGGSIDYPSIP